MKNVVRFSETCGRRVCAAVLVAAFVLVFAACWGPVGPMGVPGNPLIYKGSHATLEDMLKSWEPAEPEVNWFYFNRTENASFIYTVDGWMPFPVNGGGGGPGTPGAPGAPGKSINWLGSLPSAPTTYFEYDAYFDTTLGDAFVYMTVSGVLGWQQLSQHGADGAAGQNGAALLWKGASTTPPSNPQLNWAYYNSGDNASYIYDGISWQPLAVGTVSSQGPAGTSIVWKGDHADHTAVGLSGATQYWAYHNTTDGCAYIHNGTSWVLLVSAGAPGNPGAPGPNGTPGITWKGSYASWALILAETGREKGWAYYNTAERKSFIYTETTTNSYTDNTMVVRTGWEVLAVDGEPAKSITWKGSLSGPPPTPWELNWAYYNTTSKNAYICVYDASNNLTWDIMLPGTEIKGEQGDKGDKGDTGNTGATGPQGISITWMGTCDDWDAVDGLGTPQVNWAVYIKSESRSLIYDDTSPYVDIDNHPRPGWTILAQDGGVGADGRPVHFYIVTFDLNGGELEGTTGTFTFRVVEGGPVLNPGNPSSGTASPTTAGMYHSTPEGYLTQEFGGWFYEKENRLWRFAFDAVNEPITLKARWGDTGENAADAARVETVPVNTIEEAIAYASTNPGSYVVLLTSGATVPLDVTQKIGEGTHLVLRALGPPTATIVRSNYYSVDGVAEGHLFTLDKANSSLTIGDNVTLLGNMNTSNPKPVVRIAHPGASFTMTAGSAISGNSNWRWADATGYWNGYGASAVFVKGGLFTMKGGTISGNISIAGANATYAPALTGGAQVGGAIILYDGGRFTMSGGTISGNSNENNRATAVNVAGGTFTMTGGTITGNTTGYNGSYSAAVFVANIANNQFIMRGGSITGNTPSTPSTTGVKYDVLVYSEATALGSILLSGEPTIGQLALNAGANSVAARNYIRIVSPGLQSGANIKLGLRGEAATATVAGTATPTSGWWPAGSVILQPVSSAYTLSSNDLSLITLNYVFGNGAGNNSSSISTWSIGPDGKLVR